MNSFIQGLSICAFDVKHCMLNEDIAFLCICRTISTIATTQKNHPKVISLTHEYNHQKTNCALQPT